jgi:two-component system, chemotaxis family, CheB/CheR fusion protein
MCAAVSEAEFAALLDYLKNNRGFDFTGYKLSTLYRRIRKRMQNLNVGSFPEYVDHLEVHPEEFALLFNTILINVTGFFRDAQAWEYLRQEVVPAILDRKGAADPVRVWSAGCASGEEAYSIAMILAEAMGQDAYHRRVKIYATDVDEEALAHARHAGYDEKAIEGIPPKLRETHLERVDSRFLIRGNLRREVIFGRHDLLQDAPISRIDLLVCRNTLMYFNAEAQGRILARLHYALNNDRSFLFLGRAEMLLLHAQLFSPVEMRFRIFTKIPRPVDRNGMPFIPPFPVAEGAGTVVDEVQQLRLRDDAFAAIPIAVLVVDGEGRLAMATAQARALFGLTPQDLGRPFQDLEVSYRPLELRSIIERVMTERRHASVTDVERSRPGGEIQFFDVQVTPLRDTVGQASGASISFTDMTRLHQTQAEILRVTQERETANEELQSANEELETTNEELQSTVEELQTTNEELQSTNEELETMNEELQSTNEELRTASEEGRRRSVALAELTEFLDSILASVRLGVVVVSEELRVRLWNDRAEDLWGLRAEEVLGKPLVSLDIGLPVRELQGPMRAAFSGDPASQEMTLEAVNRKGKPVRCRISFTLRRDRTGGPNGLVLLMEEVKV